MRILVADDEHRIANTVKKGLEQERYAADVVYDGTAAFDMASTETYDAIVLDVMMPGMDGVSVCRQLRESGNHTPILLLTAKGQVADKVAGLESGADDYLTKPFAFEELLARIRALTRRPNKVAGQMLKAADLTLDPVRFSVERAGTPIALSAKEFSVLEYLMRHAGSIVSKDDLIGHIWDYEADILPNTVEVYIRNLRKKIETPFAGKKPVIETVRGFGYRIRTAQ